LKIIKKYLKVFIPLLIIEFSVILSGFWMLGDYEVKRFNVWPISEWLINYQAGFVRRGLFGELLHQLNTSTSIIPLLNQLVLGFYYCYVAIFIGVYIRSRRRSTLVLVLALLIPGGIFHMAMGAIFYTRKEILFLIHFGLLCLLYFNIRDGKKENKLLWIWLFGLLAIVGGSLLTLIHEPYLMMAYPITLLLLAITYFENKPSLQMGWFVSIYAVLIPIIFVICSLNHGNPQMSQTIWDSFTLSDRLTLAPFAPYTASLATGGLGWTLTQHLSTIYGVFITGTWVYWVFFLLANAWVLTWLALHLQNPEQRSKQIQTKNNTIGIVVNDYVMIVMFSYFISLSMLLLASDYGRWIACATNLTILFSFTISGSSIFRQRRFYSNQLLVNSYKAIEILNKKTYSLVFLIGYELIFQMPECCVQTPDIFLRFDKFLILFIEIIKKS
jgi:hypothetical protein